MRFLQWMVRTYTLIRSNPVWIQWHFPNRLLSTLVCQIWGNEQEKEQKKIGMNCRLLILTTGKDGLLVVAQYCYYPGTLQAPGFSAVEAISLESLNFYRSSYLLTVSTTTTLLPVVEMQTLQGRKEIDKVRLGSGKMETSKLLLPHSYFVRTGGGSEG